MNTAIHYRAMRYPLAGLGQSGQQPALTTTQKANIAGSGAATAAAQIIHGNYVGGVGSALMTAGLYVPGPAAIFLEVAGAVAELLGAIGIGQGCGQTCILATEFADKADALLAQNRDTYLALPAPRYQSQQQAALNIFDQVWAALISVQACGNPALGDAGKRCISDRQRGACVWQTSEGAGCARGVNSCWTQDASGNCTFHFGGAAGSGNACANWFVMYRDPIANDPCVVPDTTPAGAVAGAIAGATGLNIDPTLLMIGLGVAAVLVVALS